MHHATTSATLMDDMHPFSATIVRTFSPRGAHTAPRSASTVHPPPATPATDTLRLAVYNVWGVNPTPRRIAPYLEAHGVDIAVIVELQPPLAKRLADSAVWGFEPVVTAPRDDFYGIGIYARRDAAARGVVITEGQADVLVADDPLQRPIVTAAVAWGGRAATVVGVHPPPPFNPRMSVERDSMLRAAGELLVERGRAGILCGDINAAPWSSARRAASHAAPLHDAARGHGYAGTWPAFVPKWLGIPIDVCLIDPRLQSVEYAVGPMLGSDHRPVLTTLRWR